MGSTQSIWQRCCHKLWMPGTLNFKWCITVFYLSWIFYFCFISELITIQNTSKFVCSYTVIVIYWPRMIFFWQSLKCLNWRKLKRVISHKTDTKYGYILAHTLKVELRASQWVFLTKSQWDHYWWINFDNVSCAITSKIYLPKCPVHSEFFVGLFSVYCYHYKVQCCQDSRFCPTIPPGLQIRVWCPLDNCQTCYFLYTRLSDLNLNFKYFALFELLQEHFPINSGMPLSFKQWCG